MKNTTWKCWMEWQLSMSHSSNCFFGMTSVKKVLRIHLWWEWGAFEWEKSSKNSRHSYHNVRFQQWEVLWEWSIISEISHPIAFILLTKVYRNKFRRKWLRNDQDTLSAFRTVKNQVIMHTFRKIMIPSNLLLLYTDTSNKGHRWSSDENLR